MTIAILKYVCLVFAVHYLTCCPFDQWTNEKHSINKTSRVVVNSHSNLRNWNN